MSLERKGMIDYENSIHHEVAKIHEKDVRDARELSKKTSPKVASFWTGIPEEEIKGKTPLKKPREEKKTLSPVDIRKRSRQLEEVDNGIFAKVDKDQARKLYKFSKKEIREIMEFREKEKKIRNKKTKQPNVLARMYTSVRNFVNPEAEAEEHETRKLTAKEHRTEMRKKWGIN